MIGMMQNATNPVSICADGNNFACAYSSRNHQCIRMYLACMLLLSSPLYYTLELPCNNNSLSAVSSIVLSLPFLYLFDCCFSLRYW